MPAPADDDPDRTRAAPPPSGADEPTLQRSLHGEDRTVLARSEAGGRAASAPPTRPPGEDATVCRSTAPASVAATPGEDPRAAEGTPFGRYRLLRKLGTGGMGVVWLAWDPSFRRTVALKQIRADVDNAGATDRFLREARLAGSLRHPHIVTLYDVGSVGDRHFMTMDYVEGRTLTAWLEETRDLKREGKREGFARLREELAALALVAEAVAYAHGQGVIHRDLKPGNVLLDRENRPFVMDFGLAKEVHGETEEEDRIARTQLTHSGQLLGTPSYMSPEQADGDLTQIGPASDVWSLGVMLYEILTGSLPLEGKSTLQVIAAVLQDEPRPRPRARNPLVPEELEAVCLQATEHGIAARYRSAGEFAEELRRWLRGDPVQAKPPSRARLAWGWAVRRRALLVPATVALLTLVGATIWVTVERTRRRERGREIVTKVADPVRDFVDVVMTAEMAPEAVKALARQPLSVLDDVIEQDPAYGPARAWRGLVYQYLGRGTEAAADFEEAWKLSPDYSVVCYLRALHRLDRYAETHPLPGAVTRGTGVVVAASAPETAAETALREGALRDLDRMETVGMKGDSFGAAERRHGRALAALYRNGPAGAEDALRALGDADGPRAEMVRAIASYYLGRWDDAVAALDRHLKRWPLSVAGLRQRAKVRTARALAVRAGGGDPRGDLAAAIADLDAALRRVPGNEAALQDRGDARRALGEARGQSGEEPAAEFAAAEADFGEILARRPDHAAALVGRGAVRTMWAQEEARRGTDADARVDAAIADLEAAVAAAPGDPVARLNLASARSMRAEATAARGGDPARDLAAALAGLDEALRVQPDYSDALHARANVRLEMGLVQPGEAGRVALEAAVADAAEALRLAPGDPLALLPRAQARLALAKRDGQAGQDPRPALRLAAADAETLVAARPRDPMALHLRGQIAHATGRAEIDAGGDPRAILRAGLADLDAVLAIDPRLRTALENRAVTRSALAEAEAARGGDPVPGLEAALADLDAALALDARPASTHSARGWTRLLRGRATQAKGGDPSDDWRLALADLDAALERNPRFAQGLANRGAVRLELGQWQGRQGLDPRTAYRRAIEDYGAALALVPGHLGWLTSRASGRVALAQSQQVLGEDPRETCRGAVDDLDAVLRATPGDRASLVNRGLMRMTLGQLDAAAGPTAFAGAEADFRAAAQAGEGLAWMNLGLLYRLLNRTDDAVAAFEAAAKALPSHADRARSEIAELRGTANPAATETWWADLRAAEAPIQSGDYAAARPLLERGMGTFARWYGALSAGEQQQWLQDGKKRAELANAVYGLACVYALLAAGKSGPDATPQPVDEATGKQHRDRAFAFLEQVVRLGFLVRSHFEQDEDLVPLHGDPRWPKLLERLR